MPPPSSPNPTDTTGSAASALAAAEATTKALAADAAAAADATSTPTAANTPTTLANIPLPYSPSLFNTALTTDPAFFDDIYARLSTFHRAITPTWTPSDITFTVSLVIGDYAVDSLSRRQILSVSSAIRAVWHPYPTTNLDKTTGGLTRYSLLQLYLDGEFDQIASYTSCPSTSDDTLSHPQSASTPPRQGPAPTQPGSPTPLPSPTPLHATPPTSAAPPPRSYAAARSSPPPPSSSFRSVAQYYSADRQYSGLDNESYNRARSTFIGICDAFAIPAHQRASCIPCGVRSSEHNLPALVSDSRGLSESAVWALIQNRIHTDARNLRIRELWQSTSYCPEPVVPNDFAVSRFDRMIARLSLLQS